MRGTVSEANRIEAALSRPRTVTVIPPRARELPGMPTLSARPKRVAAYARVSTNSEEQLTSYEAQVKHYTEYKNAESIWTTGSLFLCIRIGESPGRARLGVRASIG